MTIFFPTMIRPTNCSTACVFPYWARSSSATCAIASRVTIFPRRKTSCAKKFRTDKYANLCFFARYSAAIPFPEPNVPAMPIIMPLVYLYFFCHFYLLNRNRDSSCLKHRSNISFGYPIRNKEHLDSEQYPFFIHIRKEPILQFDSASHLALLYRKIGSISLLVVGHDRTAAFYR